MLTTLDFLKGQTQMAGRIVAWLNGDRLSREDDNTLAACAVLAEVLALYLGAFAGAEFQESPAR